MPENQRKSNRDGTLEVPENWVEAAEGLAEGEAGGVALEEAPPEPEIDPTGRVEDPGADRFHWGTGRRKTACARVRVRPGSGQFLVNGKPLAEFLPVLATRNLASAPARDLKVEDKVDVFVSAFGGGTTGHGGAIRMGLGRALVKLYPDAHEFLRRHGHLSRDSRMVERKKYGKAGARRSFQWVKR
ncbi:MAG: 30S ribosomal protein S9 [Planctomycetota bacterium]|nr:MAG: 30S ribosomal protein S9 [Planctomycetota bacterium]